MNNQEDRNKRKAILGSIVFHLLLVLLLALSALTTPLPLPDEEGIMIDLGYTEEGMGIDESMVNATEESDETDIQEETVEEAVPPPAVEKIKQGEKIITQDLEKAPAINKKQEEKINVVSKSELETESETKKEPEKAVNPKSLFQKSNKKQSGGEGETEKAGNQGAEHGTEGEKEGSGDSDKGSGISYWLSGRKLTKKPDIDLPYLTQKVIVVVDITVDKEGKVIKAKAGARGSTTTDINLYKKSVQAAYETSFTSKNDAPEEQKGTITFIFIPK